MRPAHQSHTRSKHGPTGTLFTSETAPVPVGISTHGDDLLLVVLDSADTPPAEMPAPCFLESTGSRGVVRTQGHAERVAGNLLRFVVDDDLKVVQRREFVRVTAAKRVVLEDGEGELIADALTVDLSGGGMLVQLPRKAVLPAADTVYFSLYLGTGGAGGAGGEIRGSAHVVRRREDNRVALAFDHISHNDQERLIRYVFERQRVALRVTRGDGI